MNVLVINGSPRGLGSSSYRMASNFIKGLEGVRDDINLTTYHLSEKDFINCQGCLNCWRREKVECIHDDDMVEMLESYINSNLIIWVTPLYHYTITSLLKKFIERTLTINSPLQVEKSGRYSHPYLYENIEKQKHILISACGFPEHNNFNLIEDYMRDIAEGNLVETIYSGMTEMYQLKEFNNVVGKYMSNIEEAGREFGTAGSISEETKAKIKEPLMEPEAFLEIANLHWKSEGNMDHLRFDLSEKEKAVETYNTDTQGDGYKFLQGMGEAFNKNNKMNLDVKIEYQFNDTKESAYFIIKKDSIDLIPGSSDNPDLKIITTYENWLKVAKGEIDGAEALIKGLYKIEGDLNLMIKMEELFAKETSEEKPKKSSKKIMGIPGDTWMIFSFIPWILSWGFIRSNLTIATAIPLIISLAILILKKKSRSVTYFEKLNTLYFFALTVIGWYSPLKLSSIGVELNFLFMAIIWGISLFSKSSLTAEYSIYSQEGDLSDNIIFLKTNEFITLFWTALYLIQWSGMLALKHFGFDTYYPILFILLPVGFIFTNFFQKWYPNKITK